LLLKLQHSLHSLMRRGILDQAIMRFKHAKESQQ